VQRRSLEPSRWDSSGTHVAMTANRNPRFTGVSGAVDGTRTHDLLHGKCERPFAAVRSRSLKPSVCSGFSVGRANVSEPEANAEPCHSCHGADTRSRRSASAASRSREPAPVYARGAAEWCAHGQGFIVLTTCSRGPRGVDFVSSNGPIQTRFSRHRHVGAHPSSTPAIATDTSGRPSSVTARSETVTDSRPGQRDSRKR
jgi:hypothetical protein